MDKWLNLSNKGNEADGNATKSLQAESSNQKDA